MDVFQEVLQKSDILRVCDMIGLKLNRSNMCLCPFSGHNEKTPSFSVSQQKQIFKCFGCGKAGNSINLVAEIYGIKNLEAAKIINTNLGLGIEFKEKGVKIKRGSNEFKANVYEERQKVKEEFKKWQENTLRLLCEYLDILRIFKEIEDFDSDLFVESLQKKDYIEYLIDEYFINGTQKDRVELWKNRRKELNEYESRLRIYGRIGR